jgi:hypothetical protein
MNELFVRMTRTRPLRVGLSYAFLATSVLASVVARPATAQTAAAQTAAAQKPAPAPAPVAAEPPAPTQTPTVGPQTAAPPPAPEPPPAVAPPGPPPSEFPPISVALWTRSIAAIQGETDPAKLDDIGFESNFAEINLAGQIHKNARMATNIYADGLSGSVQILDAWIGFDFADEAHLFVGQMLIPVDRANKAGPFFSIPLNFFAGNFAVGGTRVLAIPIEGTRGRGTGGVFWGDLIEGKLKYLLGAFLDQTPTTSPLYSGRVGYSFIGKEKAGFGQAASFYGQAETDVVTLALGAQYRKDGSVAAAPPAGTTPPPPVAAPDDFAEVNADLFGEFKLAEGAFVTGEADFYHFSGDNRVADNVFAVMGAYASPVIGIGQIQPMLRFQFANGENEQSAIAIDAQVGYLIRQQRLRVIANFQHTELKNYGAGAADLSANKLQLAVQAQFF